MADTFRLSGDALAQLETWLPFDLTSDQMEKVMQAAAACAEVTWREAVVATRVRDRMRREVEERVRESSETDD